MDADKKILYHYTTMSTFYNMMEQSLCYEKDDIHPNYITMWATYYAFQNDPTECKLFFEGLKNSISEFTKKNNIELNDEEKENIPLSQYDLDIFTISFSKQEDDLTMWRGYGQNGDGISIGFDFSNLPSTLPMYGLGCNSRKIDPADLLKTDLIKCRYVDASNISVEKEACDRISNALSDKDKLCMNVILKQVFGDYAPIYKNKKYEAEGEYRIIKHQAMPLYRLVGNRLVPYVKVNIPIESLKRIVVGPCQSSSEVVMCIKSFLRTKGIDAEVMSSVIPYRNIL